MFFFAHIYFLSLPKRFFKTSTFCAGTRDIIQRKKVPVQEILFKEKKNNSLTRKGKC